MKRGVLAIAFVLGATGARAHADAVAEAEAFVRANDFLNAAAKYREAYAADPRPELICNVGVAYVKANDPVRAQLYLSRCLEHGTFDKTFMDQVHAAMSAVDTQLRAGDFTPIEIHVEPAGALIAIDGFAKDEAFVGGRVVWLPFGKHTIRATMEGYQPGQADVEATSHTATATTITLEKAPAKQPDAPPPPPPHQPPPPPPVVVHHSKLPAVIASAATVAAVVVAGVAFKGGHDRADLARYAISSDVYASDRDAVDGWNRALAVSGALAVVGAGVSGYLWYRAFHTETHVEIEASATGAGVGVFTRF